MRLIEQGAIAEAVALCERLRDDPDQGPDALHILGVAAAHEGMVDKALQLMGAAVRADPSNLERRLNYGSMALDLGLTDVAVEELSAVAAALPRDPMPHTLLGDALGRAGRHEEAVAAQEKAVALQPDTADLWGNLANAYFGWGKVEAAEAGYAYATQLSPESADMHFNLGGARVMLGRLEEALACFDAALARDPCHAAALTSRGVVLRAMGHHEEGMAEQERAYAIDPRDMDVRWNLGLSHLYSGRFGSGWSLYEVRRERAPQLGREGYGTPWAGEEAKNEVLVIEREQGLGDSLQFVRYLGLAAERVQKVVFRVQEGLVPLLKEGLDIPGVEIEPFQLEPYHGLYAPLLSLPHLLGTKDDLLTRRVPYLHVPIERVASWAERLGPKARPRVGIVWQGNPGYPNDARRSIPLAKLQPLLELPSVEIISLQQRHGTEQIDDLQPHLRPRTIDGPVDAAGAFVDTAAIMKNLDLVISTDTAPLHLAGALGVPTFMLCNHMPDWRWGQGAQLWYPSVQTFRQDRELDWEGPIARVVEAVKARFDG